MLRHAYLFGLAQPRALSAWLLVLVLLPAPILPPGAAAAYRQSGVPWAPPSPPYVIIDPLPPVTNVPDFSITWIAIGGPGGLGGYDIQYQVNGGPWLDLVIQTQQPSFLFTGAQNGMTYGFRGRATDKVGHEAPYPRRAQAQTTVEFYPNARIAPFNPNLLNSSSPVTTSFTLTWAGTTPPDTTITQYRIYYRLYDLQGRLRLNWREDAPWQVFDGAVTTAVFPLAQLGGGDGIYQFQAAATNAISTTPFSDVVEAEMIVDLGDTMEQKLLLPAILQE